MTVPWTWPFPLALLVAGIIPAAALSDDLTPTEIYDELISHYRLADAVHLEYTGTVEGDGRTYRGIYRLAHTDCGRVDLDIGGSPVEMVGNGEGMYVLDRGLQIYTPLPYGMRDVPLMGQIAPLAAWLSGSSAPPTSVERVRATPDHPMITVLDVRFSDHRETLWVDREMNLLASTSAMDLPDGSTVKIHVAFSRCEAIDDADEEDFVTALPEGFREVTDPNDLLLAVGSDAPDVELIGMDGQAFSLSEYRGKTVLLNFWFFA